MLHGPGGPMAWGPIRVGSFRFWVLPWAIGLSCLKSPWPPGTTFLLVWGQMLLY